MSEDQQWESWVRKLAAGDDAAAVEFWKRYGHRLERVAEGQLAIKLQRRVGPDDVVQSACRTFFRRLQDGQFELADSRALWRLLCAITLMKARKQARFHQREKRGLSVEQALEGSDEDAPGSDPASAGPNPAEEVEFEEVLQQLFATLDEEEQSFVQLKLEQHTNREIAEKLKCSERTVFRILNRVQARMKQVLDSQSLDSHQ